MALLITTAMRGLRLGKKNIYSREKREWRISLSCYYSPVSSVNRGSVKDIKSLPWDRNSSAPTAHHMAVYQIADARWGNYLL